MENGIVSFPNILIIDGMKGVFVRRDDVTVLTTVIDGHKEIET